MEQNLLLRACRSGQETVQAVGNLMVGHETSLDKSVLGRGGERKTEIVF